MKTTDKARDERTGRFITKAEAADAPASECGFCPECEGPTYMGQCMVDADHEVAS